MKDPQIRHKQLVKLLNENGFDFNLPYRSQAISSSEVHLKISNGDACNIVALVVAGLNLTGGSVGDIDLYQLLQAYLIDTEKRKQINEVLNVF